VGDYLAVVSPLGSLYASGNSPTHNVKIQSGPRHLPVSHPASVAAVSLFQAEPVVIVRPPLEAFHWYFAINSGPGGPQSFVSCWSILNGPTGDEIFSPGDSNTKRLRCSTFFCNLNYQVARHRRPARRATQACFLECGNLVPLSLNSNHEFPTYARIQSAKIRFIMPNPCSIAVRGRIEGGFDGSTDLGGQKNSVK
jgi:hypothetical protein